MTKPSVRWKKAKERERLAAEALLCQRAARVKPIWDHLTIELFDDAPARPADALVWNENPGYYFDTGSYDPRDGHPGYRRISVHNAVVAGASTTGMGPDSCAHRESGNGEAPPERSSQGLCVSGPPEVGQYAPGAQAKWCSVPRRAMAKSRGSCRSDRASDKALGAERASIDSAEGSDAAAPECR